MALEPCLFAVTFSLVSVISVGISSVLTVEILLRKHLFFKTDIFFILSIPVIIIPRETPPNYDGFSAMFSKQCSDDVSKNASGNWIGCSKKLQSDWSETQISVQPPQSHSIHTPGMPAITRSLQKIKKCHIYEHILVASF